MYAIALRNFPVAYRIRGGYGIFGKDLQYSLRAQFGSMNGNQSAATPEYPLVSVVIPARNAEGVIAAALDSILAQDYPGPMEIIVADGSDTPATAELVRRDYPQARLIANPEGTTPHGLNAAIAASTGEIIARCDGQTRLPAGYLRRAVDTLRRTGAVVTGGVQQPIRGEAPFQRAVAMALSSPLGAGDARHRLGGKEGPVDTVYLGVFRRESLVAIGGFHPALTRNQDSEVIWRLQRHGERAWFDPELVAAYHPRTNLRALARQYFDYGRWKPRALQMHPRRLRARHLAAPLLVMGLLASAGLGLAGFTALAAALPLLYAAALLLGALLIGLRRRDAAAILLPLALATMHLSWGIGFFLPARRKGGTAVDPGGRLRERTGE